ncbi:MAG: hypothetical protein K6F28_05830 [Lachnospiraceae bacterium]|nr:hypothetical protein [Lachnospiraceae bacterium]
MNEFGISQRMLQRDLKDLRDCGLINVKYNKARNMYIKSEEVQPLTGETSLFSPSGEAR